MRVFWLKQSKRKHIPSNIIWTDWTFKKTEKKIYGNLLYSSRKKKWLKPQAVLTTSALPLWPSHDNFKDSFAYPWYMSSILFLYFKIHFLRPLRDFGPINPLDVFCCYHVIILLGVGSFIHYAQNSFFPRVLVVCKLWWVFDYVGGGKLLLKDTGRKKNCKNSMVLCSSGLLRDSINPHLNPCCFPSNTSRCV